MQIGGLSLSNTTGKLAAVASYSNGSWQASLFSYDNEGRISTRYTYTHRNGTTTVLAGLNTELTYTWDLRGEPVARQAKVGTEEFGHWYEYDARGLVDEVFAQTGTIKPANSDVKYTYRPTGSRDSFDYLGGPKVDIRYDIRERIDRIGNPWLTSAKFSAEYGYNWNSTIAWSSQRNTGLSSQAHFKWDYTYDGAKRLEAADYSYWNGSSWAGSSAYDLSNIDYDDAGNLLSLQRRGQSGGLLDNLTYSYGWNSRLTGVTDAAGSTGFSGDAETGTFSYSWSGKQTAATGYGVSGTVYDYQDRPLWLWQGGNQTKYRYDEAGNRISKQTGTGDAEYYLLDGATTVAVFTATNAGTITDHYFNLIGSGGDVFGRDPDGSGTLYYYKDLLGTIRAVADGSNALVESYDYDPWGVEMEGRFTGAGVTKDGFTGKERDSESGFDYFGARHYMPAIGRWTGPDPKADLMPEWSTYNYVLGDPVALHDPDGQCPPAKECGRDAADLTIGFIPGVSTAHDATVLSTGFNVATGEYSPLISVNRAAAAIGVFTPLNGPAVRATGRALSAAGRRFVGRVKGLFRRGDGAASTAKERADELHGMLDPRAQNHRTTAVTETAEGTRVVTSSQRRLSPDQRRALGPGEVEGVGVGHAEVTGVEASQQMGLTPTATAASRPICPDCAEALRQADVKPASPLRDP